MDSKGNKKSIKFEKRPKLRFFKVFVSRFICVTIYLHIKNIPTEIRIDGKQSVFILQYQIYRQNVIYEGMQIISPLTVRFFGWIIYALPIRL